MSFLFNGVRDIGSLVERRTVQDDDGRCGNGGEKGILHPRQEDIGVDVAIPQLHGKQLKREQGANGIESSFRMPVSLPVTPRSSRGVPVRSRSIEGESALVEVHDGTPFDVFVPPYSRLESQAMHYVSLGMRQSFFYS